ncbi:MAG TPA: hypothetical protein VKV02_07070 [Acidobacteriaceae bacterium]|nr:hypothetical protein [Acidobacteriaceae bacterium]
MADYIYLLQNRLTPAQWRAVEAVREAARTHAMPVFLVGGAVRDLTSGTPVRDLDFAVQGDVGPVVAELEASGATVTGRNAALSSVYLAMRGGVRAEIGPSLTVSFPKPGEAVAQPAPILDDLRRRDFTANAMAVSLNEGSYGLLLDPLNGTADIENRELRLVSAYGFIEQPSLLLRAARLSERLGFTLEERTQSRYENSKEEGHIQALPAADRGYELEEILHEEDPISILEHMEGEGWREVLFPALRSGDADRSGLDAVRDLVGQLEGQGIHPDPSAVYFPYLTAKLQESDRNALKRALARPGFVAQVESLESRAKDLAGQLTSKSSALPSDTWRLLKDAEPEVVLWLAVHTRGGAVQSKIKAFLKEWPPMRQKIPYALMQEMRITPDLPGYDKLLDDLFFALIDGKLDTPEATRAFLEPYSPPAPPQVTVRRRPAKATRGRAKKAAAVEEEVASEPEDAAVEDEDGEEDERVAPLGRDVGKEEPESTDGDDEEEDEAEQTTERESAVPRREDSKKAPLRTESVQAEPVAVQTRPIQSPKKEAAAKKASGSAPVAPAKAAKPSVPAKPTLEPKHSSQKAVAVSKVAASAKPVAKPAPKKAAPAKKTPAKKAAPVKAPATVGRAVKLAAKKAASKTAAKIPPKKAVAKKVAGKVNPLAKAPAKKQAAKGRGAEATRRTTPAKAAKKAAVKTRGR